MPIAAFDLYVMACSGDQFSKFNYRNLDMQKTVDLHASLSAVRRHERKRLTNQSDNSINHWGARAKSSNSICWQRVYQHASIRARAVTYFIYYSNHFSISAKRKRCEYFDMRQAAEYSLPLASAMM